MNNTGPQKARHLLAATVLLLALSAQLLLSARHESATMDEQLHLLAGAAWFLSEQQRNIVGNPPLVNVIEAAPLVLLEHVRLPTDSPTWSGTWWQETSNQFLWHANGDRALQLVFLGRLPIMALALLLGAGVFRWARDLGGVAAGLLALALLAFDPNILAHGHLATTDLGTACLVFWAAYLFWRFSVQPGWQRLVLAGLGLGAALAAKFSALTLLPAFAIISTWYAGLWRWPIDLRRIWRCIAQTAGIASISALVMLSTYRFNVPVLVGEYEMQRAHFDTGHPAFLMGAYRTTGWWYYFPVAFALKTPIPLMVLGIAGAAVLLRQSRDLAMLALPPAFIFGVSLISRVNIGYRYLLPVLPFLFVISSRVLSRRPRWRAGWRLVPQLLAGALVGWHILGTLRIYPHYLAYFNLLGGGPGNGWRYLVDSNLDWGQDLPGLRDYMSGRGLDQVYLSWFGDAPPERYGVAYVPLPSWPLFRRESWYRGYHPQRPAPGVYAISATHLQGVYLDERDTYAWFREREPTEMIGYSIFVYDVPATGKEPVSACLSGVSIDEVDAETLDAAFGTNDIRLCWFDARSALVFPTGTRNAWILVGEGTFLDPWFRDRFLPDAAIWGRGQADRNGSSYALYRVDDKLSLVPGGTRPVWWSPVSVFPPGYERHSLDLPVRFDRLDFLGYESSASQLRPGDEAILATFWRVQEAPEPPLALFVHLLDTAGQVVSQHDGLDVDPVGLARGDTFVQVHRFQVPPGTSPGEYLLEVGVYRPDTMQRWPILGETGTVADRLLLEPITVEGK